MKNLYVLFILVIFFTKANAQWVTIPDTNFATFLQQNYPQCMNGNQMDTTCSAIVNATTISVINKNINSLTGIEYFDNLLNLWCHQNQLTSLPSLPLSLENLHCSENQLTSLPTLPINLEYLSCYENQLGSLPSLPSNLKSLNCKNNTIATLPPLPNSLTDLTCSHNQLTFLPILPAGLTYLSCASNQITTLPNLPNNLGFLHCSFNPITSLPNLPGSLQELFCSSNQLTSLPNLPGNLITLECTGNQITNLNNLPDLEILLCGDNQLTSLPTLPLTLTHLYCDNNQLTTLPTLPSSLTDLRCKNNLLTSLPSFPDSLNSLYILDNPNLVCLPQLKSINFFFFNNTNIQCLPNYGNVSFSNPPLSSLPLCNIFNNPNNCNVYWNISGKVYHDDNNNCINDASEQGLSGLKLQLHQNGNLIQQVYSGGEGLFSFDTDTGTFTYTVDTTDLPIHVTCPTSGFHTSILTPLDSMDYNMDFAMQCKPGFDVGVKSITRTTGQFFPGNTATVKIGSGDMASFYGLTCANGISGSVVVDFTGPVTFVSEASGALVPSVVGNTLTYTIADFGLVNFNSDFRIIVQTDTTAQAGDQVCFTVNVIPTTGDNDVSNNSMQHCFSVVNSFDPNAKEVYPEGGIPLNQEWLTYTIHFQNTGNAPAQNIYVLDTLDQNLIPETFTLLSYSHVPLTQLFGNVVKFNFPNINLPDSTNDEPNSHGFVQYKIKLSPNLPVGTTISNIAYNFFDFNSPVATNSVENSIGVTSVAYTNEKVEFSVFPNPTTSEINISFNLNSSSGLEIKLYNSLGQVVKTLPKTKYEAGKHLINFSVADLPVGVYHLKAMINNQTIMRKIVKC